MATKTDLKKILSKGSLTGKEAGRLILQDNWLVDHYQEGFLSNKDVNAIKASLRSSKDIEDYNSYVYSYKYIDYTLKEARIKSLELRVRLDAVIKLILMYLFDVSSELELYSTPVIMTKKEYLDHEASQKAYLLKELTDLHEILDHRAVELAGEEIHSQEPEDSYSFFDWTGKAYPGIWRQAITDILDLLKADRLKPIQITGGDKERLDALWTTIRKLQDDLPIHNLPKEDLASKVVSGELSLLTGELPDKLRVLDQENDKTLQELYHAGKKKHSKKSQADLIASLEKLLAGSMSEEEEISLLYYAFCSGDDLYRTGLPEWVEWIETYKPGYTTTERGEDIGRGIAIIVDPLPSQVDKRGYYRSSHNMATLLESKRDVLEALQEGTKKTKEEAKIVLAFQSVIEAVSEVIGIDFAEDIRAWVKEMEEAIADYNRIRLRASLLENIPEEIKNSLQVINLDKLKPSKDTEVSLRSRLALSLGRGWQEDAGRVILKDLQEKEASDGKEA